MSDTILLLTRARPEPRLPADLPPSRHSQLNTLKREPLGTCALITSFNHPLLISIKKLAFALAAGNSVVIKPSDLAPLSVLELGQVCKDGGLPDGVLSILPGGIETGKALVASPVIKKVQVTSGSLPACRTKQARLPQFNHPQ